MRRFFVFILLISAIVNNGVAQYHPLQKVKTDFFKFDKSNPVYTPFEYRVLETKDGLNPKIAYLFTDSRGTIWIAPWTGGIFSYDGKKVKLWDELNGFTWDNVYSMQEDNNGDLWFMSPIVGLTRYDGIEFTYVDMTEPIGRNRMRDILKKKDGELILTYRGDSSGVAILANDTIEKIRKFDFLKGVEVKEFELDKDDNLWIATYGKGLIKYDWNTFEFYNKSNGYSDSIWDVKFDKEATMWYIIHKDTIYHVERNKHTNITSKLNVPVEINMNFHNTRDGNIWLGCDQGTYKLEFNKLTKIGYANNILSTKTNCFELDMDGNMVFGTNYGLAIEEKKKFYEYGNEEGLLLKNKGGIFRDDNGWLWMGQDGYFTIVENEIAYHYKLLPEIKDNMVREILKGKDGKYYILTMFGILAIGETNVIIHRDREEVLPDGYAIEDLVMDKDGTIYFASRAKGVFSIKNDACTRLDIQTDWYENFAPQCLFIDNQDNLWIGNDGQYIFKRTPEGKVEWGEYGSINNSVMTIFQDSDGIFWTGSYGGLNIFLDSNFHTIGKEQGLSGNNINLALEDNQGGIWIGSFDGISKITKPKNFTLEQFDSLKHPQIKTYTYNEGFKGYSLNRNCTMVDNDGSIWFAAEGNFYNFRFENDVIDSVPPKIYFLPIQLKQNNIDTLKKYGKLDYDYKEKWSQLPIGLKLPYSENTLTFNFKAIKGNNVDDVLFKHKLIGYDNEWTNWSKNTSFHYSNLKPGKYTIEIIAENFDNVESEPELFSFEILTPYYMTWWFRVLVGLTLLFIIFLIFKWRLKALKDRQIELEKIVDKRTTELQKSHRDILSQKETIEEKNEELNQMVEEISAQRDKLSIQKAKLAFKNKEVEDSITAAKRIQEAFFQSEDREKALLPEHFAIFKPRDIVSGDFYWSHLVEEHADKVVYLSVADCTGHGVPGALMSMLGLSLIKEVFSEDTTVCPSNLLTSLREKVIHELKQTEEGVSKEGMDMSVIKLNLTTNELLYSGANNPLYYYSEGELKIIKGSKQPIGISEIDRPFAEHKIKLSKGDMIYLFSDGYPDQFGGPKGKKMGYKRFREQLSQIQSLPTKEQKKHLLDFMKDWQGYEDQLDDMCIVGMRV